MQDVKVERSKGPFFNCSTLTVCILDSVVLQRHTVPHFKGLIKLNLDSEAQGHGSTISLYHALLKKRRFIGKRAIVRRLLSLAVCVSSFCIEKIIFSLGWQKLLKCGWVKLEAAEIWVGKTDFSSF